MNQQLINFLQLEPKQREQAFVDFCIQTEKKEAISELTALIEQFPQKKVFLNRWKARIILQDSEKITQKEFQWLISEHLIEGVFTSLDITQTIIEYLYFTSKKQTQGISDEDYVKNTYMTLRSFLQSDVALPTVNDGETYTIKSILKKLHLAKKSTLEYTQEVTKLQKYFSVIAEETGIEKELQPIAVREALTYFLDLIDFLQDPNPDFIYSLVTTLMEPEIFENDSIVAPYIDVKDMTKQDIYNDIYDKILQYFGYPWNLDEDGIVVLTKFLTDIATEINDPTVKNIIEKDEKGSYRFNKVFFPENDSPEIIKKDSKDSSSKYIEKNTTPQNQPTPITEKQPEKSETLQTSAQLKTDQPVETPRKKEQINSNTQQPNESPKKETETFSELKTEQKNKNKEESKPEIQKINIETQPEKISASETDTELYQKIQSEILVEYGDISRLSPQEITPIIAILSKKADEHGNEKITELVYFDAKQQSFVWNKDLLIV